MTIEGQEGTYDQGNKIINLRGKVRGRTNDGMTLTTEQIAYSEPDQKVTSDTWVTIAGPRFKVTGHGLLVRVPENQITFLSQVDSTFVPEGKGPPPAPP